mgnify:CR=1 FL=1
MKALRTLLLILLLSLVPHLVAGGAPSRLTVTSYGAAGQVSGSLHILDTGDGRWMIDCGAVIDKKTAPSSARDAGSIDEHFLPQTLPAGVEKVDALLLTHAHVDHLGRLPLLASKGFSGPIFATEATATLAVPMLRIIVRRDLAISRDWAWSPERRLQSESSKKSLWVHWRLCKYRQAINDGDQEHAKCSLESLKKRFQEAATPVKVVPCEECIQSEVDALLRYVKTVKYNDPHRLATDVYVTFLDAGHIPGSASLLFEVDGPGSSRRIIFSGDLGNGLSPLAFLPPPAPPADVIFVEATYGNITRDPVVQQQRQQFRRNIGQSVAKQGVTWIPCYSLDRTQKILYELHLAQRERLIPESLPIYCPSPTAKEVTELYRKNRPLGWFPPAIAKDCDAFFPREVRGTVPSAKRLPCPCIIISSSDLTAVPWMRRLLTAVLPEKTTGIFLVGYQDSETSGERLLQGARSLDIDGQKVPIAATVSSYSCFSGHGDASDIDRWLIKMPKTSTVVLVHGDHADLETRARQLRARFQHVLVARAGATIDLTEATMATDKRLAGQSDNHEEPKEHGGLVESRVGSN